MRHWLRALAPATLLLLACSQDAPAPSGDAARARILEILDMLGVSDGRATWTKLAVENLDQFSGLLVPAQLEELRQAAREAYDGDRMLGEMVGYFAEHFDAASSEAIVAHYAGPVGSSVRAATLELTQPGGPERLESFAAGLEESPPSDVRLELVRRFVATTRTGDQAVSMVVGISEQNARAMTGALASRADAEQLIRNVENLRAQLLEGVRNQAMIAALYMFQGLSDEQLRVHVDFTESAPFGWYLQNVFPAVERAVTAAGRDFGTRAQAILAG